MRLIIYNTYITLTKEIVCIVTRLIIIEKKRGGTVVYSEWCCVRKAISQPIFSMSFKRLVASLACMHQLTLIAITQCESERSSGKAIF